jgi:hypothetical protein
MGRLDPALKTSYRGGTTDDVEAEVDSYMLCTTCGQVYDLRAPAETMYHSQEHGGHDPVDDSEFSPRELEKRRAFAPLLRSQAPAARVDHNEVRHWHEPEKDRP